MIDEEFIEEKASSLEGTDLDKVVDRAEDIKAKFQNKGPLKRFFDDFKLILELIRDYRSGDYTGIPWWAISAVAFALLYVLNPADLMPDFIPGLGHVDDALVVSLCLMMIEKELKEYLSWKVSR